MKILFYLLGTSHFKGKTNHEGIIFYYICYFSVVIDRRTNKDADTGMFELAYRQDVSNPPPYTGMNLTVRGMKLRTGPRISRPDEIKTDHNRGMKEAIRRLSEQLKDDSSSGARVCLILIFGTYIVDYYYDLKLNKINP